MYSAAGIRRGSSRGSAPLVCRFPAYYGSLLPGRPRRAALTLALRKGHPGRKELAELPTALVAVAFFGDRASSLRRLAWPPSGPSALSLPMEIPGAAGARATPAVVKWAVPQLPSSGKRRGGDSSTHAGVCALPFGERRLGASILWWCTYPLLGQLPAASGGEVSC